jgi:hypothetical protein
MYSINSGDSSSLELCFNTETQRCGQVAAELNVVFPAIWVFHITGGGELCNEGMLRKLGPTGSLTTFIDMVCDLLSLAFYV